MAIDLIDRYYLTMSQRLEFDEFKRLFMNPRQAIEYQLTCLLIASKLIELDEKIVKIELLRTYVSRQLKRSTTDRCRGHVPTYKAIIDCEQRILEHFSWDLNFTLPVAFVRMLLVSGVLFSSELKLYEEHLFKSEYSTLKTELSRAISAEALALCDLLILKGSVLLREKDPSDIAASIVYYARRNILESEEISKLVQVPCLWPHQMYLLTRCREDQIYRIVAKDSKE